MTRRLFFAFFDLFMTKDIVAFVVAKKMSSTVLNAELIVFLAPQPRLELGTL